MLDEASARPLSRAAFALAAGGFALTVFTRNQEFVQHMKVASQNAQRDITFQAQLAAVATAFQPISRLERSDGGLHTGVTLTSLPK